jgi:hypothetical protein
VTRRYINDQPADPTLTANGVRGLNLKAQKTPQTDRTPRDCRLRLGADDEDEKNLLPRYATSQRKNWVSPQIGFVGSSVRLKSTSASL